VNKPPAVEAVGNQKISGATNLGSTSGAGKLLAVTAMKSIDVRSIVKILFFVDDRLSNHDSPLIGRLRA